MPEHRHACKFVEMCEDIIISYDYFETGHLLWHIAFIKVSTWITEFKQKLNGSAWLLCSPRETAPPSFRTSVTEFQSLGIDYIVNSGVINEVYIRQLFFSIEKSKWLKFAYLCDKSLKCLYYIAFLYILCIHWICSTLQLNSKVF